MVSALVALAGASACGQGPRACEIYDAAVFRENYQAASADRHIGFGGYSVRLYGGGEGARMGRRNNDVFIEADAPGVVQILGAGETHYFAVESGRTRVRLDGGAAVCERR